MRGWWQWWRVCARARILLGNVELCLMLCLVHVLEQAEDVWKVGLAAAATRVVVLDPEQAGGLL